MLTLSCWLPLGSGKAVCGSCSGRKVRLHRWLEQDKPHALRESLSAEALRVCDDCYSAGSVQAGVLVDSAMEGMPEPRGGMPEPELEPI